MKNETIAIKKLFLDINIIILAWIKAELWWDLWLRGCPFPLVVLNLKLDILKYHLFLLYEIISKGKSGKCGGIPLLHTPLDIKIHLGEKPRLAADFRFWFSETTTKENLGSLTPKFSILSGTLKLGLIVIFSTKFGILNSKLPKALSYLWIDYISPFVLTR